MSNGRKMRALGLYAAIMEEVKIRLSSIDSALAGQVQLPGAIVREFCFLQLRMICELIALGCLTAHGDIRGTSALRKEYSAGRIIERLEGLHSKFFPWSINIERTSPGAYHAMTVETGFLTKSGLLTLNGRCGDVLHRGSLRKLISPKAPAKSSSSDVVTWHRRIETLLNQHAIQLFDKKLIMICTLRNADDNNRVQVALTSTDPPTRPPT